MAWCHVASQRRGRGVNGDVCSVVTQLRGEDDLVVISPKRVVKRICVSFWVVYRRVGRKIGFAYRIGIGTDRLDSARDIGMWMWLAIESANCI